MELTRLNRLIPTMDMIAEHLVDQGILCQRSIPDPEQRYRGILLFTRSGKLEKDIIYLVRDGDASLFPGGYACVCARPTAPGGNRLLCPEAEWDLLLQLLLEYFCQLQDQEVRLNSLVFSEGDLQNLCALGQQLLGNPVCIHDDWFILIAASSGLPRGLAPERVAESDRNYIPRQVVEELQFDPDFEETYTQRRCQLWDRTPGTARSLYVNLYQESRYLGRLLIFETDRPFRAGDFLLAEALAQRAMLMLIKQTPDVRQYRNLDDVVVALLERKPVESEDLGFLLDTLKWHKDDQYLVIQLRHQQQNAPEITGHILHSDLFRLFSSGYILYLEQQQTMILNLTRDRLRISEIRYRLAPLCRDYCLYAGLSSPVQGLDALNQAARQSEIAIEKAFYTHGERWLVPFADCALDYMLSSVQTALEPRHLAAPEWLMLLEHDQQKDTRFFETLRAWLLAERDIPRAAQALIIHRTTLLYRLKRIMALTGLNLDDPNQRLYLLLSLRLLEQHRLVPTDSVTMLR